MFNNGFGNNNFNSASKNFQTGNIAGITKTPTNIGGINKNPSNINGINNIPTRSNPFSNVKIDRQMSKSIMNSSGENIISNKNGGN